MEEKDQGSENNGFLIPKGIWQVSIFFKIICHHPPFLSQCELTDETFLQSQYVYLLTNAYDLNFKCSFH